MSISRLTQLAGVALLAVVVGSGTAKATMADPPPLTGQLSFTDLGSPSVNTGNINTAMTFTVADLTTTTDQTGVFMGLGSGRSMSAFTFNPSVGTSLDFSNTVFGTFKSTSIMEVENKVGPTGGSVAFDVRGNWTPGSFFSLGHGPFAVLLTMGFTQTPAGAGGVISNSGSFSVPIPKSVTPEPPSAVLVLTGLLCGVGIYALRRHRHPIVTA